MVGVIISLFAAVRQSPLPWARDPSGSFPALDTAAVATGARSLYCPPCALPPVDARIPVVRKRWGHTLFDGMTFHNIHALSVVDGHENETLLEQRRQQTTRGKE